VIECHVCPLLNDLHHAEQRLYGDGTLYADVKNLYDLQYWHTRNKDAKERTFNRVKSVLTAWENPAQTIKKALDDIDALIASAAKDPRKAVYDVFFRIIPLHLAIAPPSGSAWKTRIGKEYTEFCKCDDGSEDACCGPDVGELSLRQRLIGPQAYLVDPNDYFKIICCLVDKRYGPAKDALAKAEAELLAVDNQIKRLKLQLEGWTKTFDQQAKGAIPANVDCCDYEKEPRRDDSRQSR
jgi:hypothetical protein